MSGIEFSYEASRPNFFRIIEFNVFCQDSTPKFRFKYIGGHIFEIPIAPVQESIRTPGNRADVRALTISCEYSIKHNLPAVNLGRTLGCLKEYCAPAYPPNLC